jgi:hypothetical protein
MPFGLMLFGPIGVVAAIGLIEFPAMIYCWLQLHRLNVLNMREELSFLGIVASGAVIGWLGGTEILRLYPQI